MARTSPSPVEPLLGRTPARTRFARVYQPLLRARFEHVLSACLPRTWSALGDRAATCVHQWLRESPPHTRAMPEVPEAFAQWLRGGREVATVVDLARYEAARTRAWLAPDEPPSAFDPQAPLAPDAQVAVAGSLQRIRVGSAVHDPSAPQSVAYHLLLVRTATSQGEQLRVTEVSAHVARLVGRLSKGQTIGTALKGLREPTEGWAHVFGTLHANGVLLGRRVHTQTRARRNHGLRAA